MEQRRAAAHGLLLTGLGVITGLLMLGTTHYRSYPGYLWSAPDYLHAWTASLSPRATLLRLLDASSQERIVVNGLTLALDAALFVLFARVIPRAAPPTSSATDWAWALGLSAIPLLSPLTEEHHLVVLLAPLSLLLREPKPPFLVGDKVPLPGSMLLLASRYSFEQFPAFQQGPLSLLAAGKILGVAGLAWVLMGRLKTADEGTQ